MILLDTHVVVWLYSGDAGRFSHRAIGLIENDDLVVSPGAVLETEYLYETGKITARALEIIECRNSTIGLLVCEMSFHRVVVESPGLTWTRDPFDHLIVGPAQAAGSQLLKKDALILRMFKGAVWD